MIHAGIARTQRFPEDARRVGDDAAAIDRNPPRAADEAGSAVGADVLAGVARRVDHDAAVGVAIVDRSILRPGFHDFGRIRIDRPSDDVVVVRAPVHIPDEESGQGMAGPAGVRPPGQRSEPHVPIEALGDGLGFVRGPVAGDERAGRAVGIDFLQPADPPVAHQVAGLAELAVVLRPLLHAGLVDPAETPAGLDQVAALADGGADRLLAVHIFPGPQGHRGHQGGPVIGQGQQHGVDIGPGEDFAKIVVGLDSAVAGLARLLGVDLVTALVRLVAPLPAHVAHGQHLHIVTGDVAAGNVGPRAAQQVPRALAA